MADHGLRAVADFDPVALRERYRAERDKRLRDDKLDQYVRISGEFEHFLDDPYVESDRERAPLTDQVDVAVIGGGFGGLLVGARLRQAGIEDLRLIERGGDVGGTWYWNRYPGAACDIESYIYMPLLEELGYVPSRKFARAAEIREHCRNIAEKFDLYRNACLQTQVTGLTWDEAAGLWTISTNRGDAMRARFVVLAGGALDRPKLPGVPGIEAFEGHSFHTSRWDYDYTGGDAEGGLTGLGDKVVGIIGTGATAVQCIPHLAEGAKHLYVFQRTPSTINERIDRLTDPAWAATLEPGWQRKRIENFTALTSGVPVEEDLVQDGWTDIFTNTVLLARRRIAAGEQVDDPGALVQLADFAKMEQLRARVDATVRDRATAEALKPWYDHFCKRPCFHESYLDAFNRPNVTLVDTEGKGVEKVNGRTIVAAGREYEVDCLVYATGFEVGTGFTRRLGFEITGRGGQTLTERWRDGAATLHGFSSRGFPNLLILSFIQAGFSYNFPHMIGEQADHIAYILRRAHEEGAERVEVSQEAEDGWVAEIERFATHNEAFLRECTPGYYNYEGDVARMNARNSSYGKGPLAYAQVLREWRDAGDLAGLELS